jgi:hypothetical protein
VIRFECHNDFLEVDLASQEDAELPSRGDAYLTIRVSSAGFAGHNDLWVSGVSLRAFCSALTALERSRRGEATIESIEPSEFKLTVCSVNSRGHMAMTGETGYHVQGENRQYWHAVDFGFEFDSSRLGAAISVKWVRNNSPT